MTGTRRRGTHGKQRIITMVPGAKANSKIQTIFVIQYGLCMLFFPHRLVSTYPSHPSSLSITASRIRIAVTVAKPLNNLAATTRCNHGVEIISAARTKLAAKTPADSHAVSAHPVPKVHPSTTKPAPFSQVPVGERVPSKQGFGGGPAAPLVGNCARLASGTSWMARPTSAKAARCHH